jgi:hypothetical protein
VPLLLPLLLLLLLLVLAVDGGRRVLERRARLKLADVSLEWARVADAVGGLEVQWSAAGRPVLRGRRDGRVVEIRNDIDLGVGFSGRLGLLSEVSEGAPRFAIWTGPAPRWFGELLGAPRPYAGTETHDLYTRSEAGAWWVAPALREALLALPAGCLLSQRGRLTVLFDDFDAETVRAALQIPATLREASKRPTLH